MTLAVHEFIPLLQTDIKTDETPELKRDDDVRAEKRRGSTSRSTESDAKRPRPETRSKTADVTTPADRTDENGADLSTQPEVGDVTPETGRGASLKCPVSSCSKTFRRQSNVEHHVKYFHSGDVTGTTPTSNKTPSSSRRRTKTNSTCKAVNPPN